MNQNYVLVSDPSQYFSPKPVEFDVGHNESSEGKTWAQVIQVF
jgi:hypothetical protein